LTTWAAKHQVQLWVAGDKAYGEFRETTLNPDASVKFLVTGKKGKFAVKTQTASNPRSKKKPKAPSSSKKRKPVVRPTNAKRNYHYMPEAIFRTARGKIENEFAKFKDWLRFGHKLGGSLDLVDSESVILAFCENVLIDRRLKK
jgi:hypothetical protein